LGNRPMDWGMINYINWIANDLQSKLKEGEEYSESGVVSVCVNKLPLWYQLALNGINTWAELTRVVGILDQVSKTIVEGSNTDHRHIKTKKKKLKRCFKCGKLGSHLAINCKAKLPKSKKSKRNKREVKP